MESANKPRKGLYNWFRILLFVISLGIISWLLPRQGKFSYEFQKNSIWNHEDLFAEFDFPIRKTEAELQAERDSILAEFKPYFNHDAEKVSVLKARLDIRFTKQWKEYAKEKFGRYHESSAFQQKKKSNMQSNISKILDFIYEHGIIEDKAIQETWEKEQTSVYIKKGKVYEEKLFSDVFDEESAYRYMLDEVKKMVSDLPDTTNSLEYNFYKSLDLYELVDNNLQYDEKTSKKVKEDLIAKIYPTSGLIQEDQLIVRKGEIVNDKTFKILQSYKKEYENRIGMTSNISMILLGKILIIVIAMLMVYMFLFNFRPEILLSSWKTAFILSLITLMVFACYMQVNFLNQVSFYVIPFAILPITIRVFYDSRLALFIHIITVLIAGMFNLANPFEHVFLNVIVGIVAIFSLTNLYRRDRLVIASAYVIISYSIVYFAFSLTQEGRISEIPWINFGWFAVNGFLVLITYPLIFIFEKSFGFLSDTTLMELSDTNQPLLRKLAEEAPGTFQHSMQVANLAEEAIRHIGGNPMLVRTGALYHDIGKTVNPMYFIENQASGFNPHDNISFEESARIIISHVEEGVKIAKKHGLPEQIIDFIRTHHGTSTVHYFYRSYLNKYPEKEVDIKEFSYPGPKPFSKETAVLMMADSVEAASRSMKDITAEKIDELVDNIISLQTREEQYVDADITFKDITTVKGLFKRKLRNIYHARIEYPKEKQTK